MNETKDEGLKVVKGGPYLDTDRGIELGETWWVGNHLFKTEREAKAHLKRILEELKESEQES